MLQIMRIKLVVLLLSSVTLQCNGQLSVLGGILATAHDRIHTGVQDVAGSILGGLSHGAGINFGFNAHTNRIPPPKKPMETVVVILDNDNHKPNYQSQNHGKYPPANNEYNNYNQNNGHNQPRPNYNDNPGYNNNNYNYDNNYGRPQNPNNNGYFNNPGQGYNEYPNNPNQGYRPNDQNNQGQGYRPNNHKNQGQGYRPNDQNNQGYRPYEQNNHGQVYQPNEQNNLGQGYRPNDQNNQGQGYRPYEQNNHGQGYQPNKPNNQGQGYRPINQNLHQEDNYGNPQKPNQGFNNNRPNNQNNPSYPNYIDSPNHINNNQQNYDQYTTEKVPQTVDSSSTTENLKDDYPLFVPLNPKDVEGNTDNVNAPKRETDDLKPKPSVDDNDYDLPIDIRLKN